MTDSRELLEKADALLGRYRQGAAGDPDIPVLTEVVELSLLRGEVRTETPQLPADSGLGKSSAARLSPEDLERLQMEVATRVLASLRGEIATMLEESLRAKLEEHLRRALTALTGQLKLDIEELLPEAVDRAVKDELERSLGPPPGGAR